MGKNPLNFITTFVSKGGRGGGRGVVLLSRIVGGRCEREGGKKGLTPEKRTAERPGNMKEKLLGRV